MDMFEIAHTAESIVDLAVALTVRRSPGFDRLVDTVADHVFTDREVQLFFDWLAAELITASMLNGKRRLEYVCRIRREALSYAAKIGWLGEVNA